MMTDVAFLASLDLPDSLVLNVGAEFCVHGWIVSGRVGVDEVFVECNGLRYRADYPLQRADVAAYYPEIEGAEMSGFLTPSIALDAKVVDGAEIRLLARCKGSEHEVLARKIRLLWSDPDTDLFSLGVFGPFRHPDAFDESCIAHFDGCAPVFLLGDEDALSPVLGLYDDKGHAMPGGEPFLLLLDAIVACFDVYSEFYQVHFRHLERNLDKYAIGRFSIYEVLNQIIATIHENFLLSLDGGHFVCALKGKSQVILVPLLCRIYPDASFVFLGADDADEAALFRGERRSAREIWRLLKHVPGFLNFHEINAHDASSVFEAVNLLLENGPGRIRTRDGTPGCVRHKEGQLVPLDYLQALPVIDGHRPVFVLGAGRSGTSAMTGALKAAGVEGFHEGHVFPLFDAMAKRLWEGGGVVSPDASVVGMRALLVRVVARTSFEQIYGLFSGKMWQDKTPDHLMIDCIPFVRTMLPQARFLFMRRHPIAYAQSRHRKFGDPPLVAIAEWNKCIHRWNAHKQSLDRPSYLECDASDLKIPVLQSGLNHFLGLDEANSRNCSNYLASQRPEFTRLPGNMAVVYEHLEDARRFNLRTILFSLLDAVGVFIEDTDWDEDTVREVEKALGSMPDELGYRLHRSPDYLLEMLFPVARQLEEYRYTAEFHQKNTKYWEEQASTWRAMAESSGLARFVKTLRYFLVALRK